MEWFRKASDAGHAHSSYNLAIGYLTGIRSDVRPGEAQRLIQHAHDNGVEGKTNGLIF
jgi:TPR repeat protein